MLSIHDQGAPLCDGLTRRDWLRVGGLGLFGLSLPGLLQQRTAQAAEATSGKQAKSKSCIVLFMLGGPPQHETWDPKPEAPVEIRGNIACIASAVPGVYVGEYMPRTAKVMDKIAVLRGMTTQDNAHSTSGYAMTTGVSHRPLGVENANPGAPNNWPSIGAIVKHLRPGGELPSSITLPNVLANDGNKTWPGQDGGFLGRGADPWLLVCDPDKADFKLPDLSLPAEVPALRFDKRRTLLQQVDRHVDAVERGGAVDRFDQWQHQAFALLGSSKARRAFDLTQEPATVRDRYGRNKFGQSVLLARRLIEAGVALTQVTWPRIDGALNNGHWDTHSKNAEALRTVLMPRMDQAYSALLEDMSQRGLLDDTLVVWMGEFGRTPKINGNGGRDHWGKVFSVALAGGGVRGGQVHGASDRHAAAPIAGRVGPADLSATIFHCLGLDPQTPIVDTSGRPHPISYGRVIREIL